MQIIHQGLKVTTNRHYLKFTKSRYFDVVEDHDLDSITIFFPSNLSTKYLVDKRIQVLHECYLKETDYIKIVNPSYKIGDITFTKLTPHNYVFRQFIVSDIENFMMSYNEHTCTVLIPKSNIFRSDLYKGVLNKNPYLDIIDAPALLQLHNIRSVNLRDFDINVDSDNEFEFNSKKFYQQYLLDRVTTEKSFIDQLTTIVRNYGMDIIRYPIDSNTNSTNYIVWKYIDIGKQLTHKSESNPLHHAILNKDQLSLEFSCSDLAVLNDIKTKYQNIEFLTNFTTFKTRDKLSREWTASVNWGPFPTDFNQDYDTDSQGNAAFKAMVDVELQYYVVEDQLYRSCQEIILEIVNSDVSDGTSIVTSEQV